MMVNANKIKKEESLLGTKLLKNAKHTKTPIGVMYQLSEYEVRSDRNAMNQGYWFLLFLEMLGGLTKSTKFLELRQKV